MPLMLIHSAGIGTTPPLRSASAALRRSPFVQVKNLEAIVLLRTTFPDFLFEEKMDHRGERVSKEDDRLRRETRRVTME